MTDFESMAEKALQQTYTLGLGDKSVYELEIVRLRESLRQVQEILENCFDKTRPPGVPIEYYELGLSITNEALSTPAPSPSALMSVLWTAVKQVEAYRRLGDGKSPEESKSLDQIFKNTLNKTYEAVDDLSETDRTAILALEKIIIENG